MNDDIRPIPLIRLRGMARSRGFGEEALRIAE